MKNNMNIFNKMDKDWDTMLDALRATGAKIKEGEITIEPDDVETELIEGAVDRDGSYEQAYSDYVSEEMNAMLANRFN